MSHVVMIRTVLRDAEALRLACNRLQLACPIHRTVQLFSGAVEGLAIEFPGWRYPIVCNLDTGELKFDNFGGQWGAQRELDRLMQAYAIEKTKLEARRKGYSVLEQPLEDGSVKLTVQFPGATA